MYNTEFWEWVVCVCKNVCISKLICQLLSPAWSLSHADSRNDDTTTLSSINDICNFVVTVRIARKITFTNCNPSLVIIRVKSSLRKINCVEVVILLHNFGCKVIPNLLVDKAISIVLMRYLVILHLTWYPICSFLIPTIDV